MYLHPSTAPSDLNILKRKMGYAGKICFISSQPPWQHLTRRSVIYCANEKWTENKI
jgi:hypothetical protein